LRANMKINIHFTAKKRESFGTSISRNLRAKNQIPAIIYGEKKNNDHIVLKW
jgi:ribosomal protein L25 (general stress protein Ctc)